jgi:transcriptional antiterminator RfaH
LGEITISAVTPKASWFAIYTKPRQERIALENLERQGFRCFLPMALNPYQRFRVGGASAATAAQRAARKTGIEPLFPRYLFLNATPSEQSLGPIRSTRGVSTLVRFGTKLVEIPERVIRTIDNRKDPETGLVLLDPVPVQPGDKVEVFDGPLAGIQGIFQERRGEARAVLLMNLLGRVSTIEVDSLHLKKCM